MAESAVSTHVRSIPAPRSAIPQLETIRALAMIGIFSHHLWKTVIVSPRGPLERVLDVLFSSASDGVIVFNIISGFLLASPYFGATVHPFAGYRAFLRKRALRIVPPYYLALLLFTGANMLRFDVSWSDALHTLMEHLLFINSLNYFNMYLNFSHFWYIGLLAQFYLLFPIFLWLFKKYGGATTALFLIAVCWGSWILLARLFPADPALPPGTVENLMHFNLPGRLPEFVIGMWLATLRPHSERSSRSIFKEPFFWFIGAMVVIFIGGVSLSLATLPLPLVHIVHVALTTLLYLICFVRPLIASAGEMPVVKDVAKHSYALYIVHYPLFSYLGVMPSNVTHSLGNFAFLMAVLMPVCYLAARLLDTAAAWIMRRLFGEKL